MSAFKPESDQAKREADEEARYSVDFAANMRTGGLALPVTVTNISRNGYRAITRHRLCLGDAADVQIGDRPFISAQAAWIKGDRVGCRFTRPITKEMLDKLVSGRSSIDRAAPSD